MIGEKMTKSGRWLLLPGFLGLVLVVALSGARAQSRPWEDFMTAQETLNQGNYEEARQAFSAILEACDTPENRDKPEYGSLIAGSHYFLGETYFLENNYQEAVTCYEKVIGSFRFYAPESLYHLGLARFYLNQRDQAIALFGDLVSQYPSSLLAPEALYYKAVCHELEKDPGAALKTYQTMIDQYPQHPWTKKAREKISAK